jgi:nitroreductase
METLEAIKTRRSIRQFKDEIMLAAQGKGLGAVWTGIYPQKERVNGIKALLKLPKNIIPLVLIVIGYPAEQLPVEDRYAASRVHYNAF